MGKTFYQTDDLGRFIGPVDADIDPRETEMAGQTAYAGPPRGAVETPPPPASAGHVAVWSDDAWNIMTEAEAENGGPLEIEAWRAQATLSRLEMAMALKSATILTHAQAMELAGGNIPAPLAAFIALLPDDESREYAELATIAGQPFDRASPLWDAVAAADTGPTEAEIDALFGWTG